MSSFNYHYRPSGRKIRSRGTIFVRIIHNRIPWEISTGHHVFPEEWDENGRTVIVPYPSSSSYRMMKDIKDSLDAGEAEFYRIIAGLSAKGSFTVKDIKAAYLRRDGSGSLRDFIESVVEEISPRQPRTAEIYLSSLRSLEKCYPGRTLKFSDINDTMMVGFETYLKEREKPLALNTISSYMRNLRAVFNRAIRQEIIPKPLDNPFRNVYTKIAKTEKKSLDAREMREVVRLDPAVINFKFDRKKKLQRPMRDALGYFLFCFFAQGMSFVDMAYLRKNDIEGDVIRYRRRKTGQLIEVILCSEMRSIIAYFADRTKTSEYLFPVIVSADKPARLQYQSALRLQNMRLKKLGLLTSSGRKISTHSARHSWATIAKHENIEISRISEALGHNSESTTRIYLDAFSKREREKTTERIRDAIKKAV